MNGLTKKLDNFSQDIFSLLEEHEPKMLMWREIRGFLWPKYENKYRKSGRKGFGVALSYKLTLMKAAGYIKHEGDCYGTSKSSVKESEQSLPVTDRQMKQAIKKLKSRLTRAPEVTEVAREIIANPENPDVRRLYHRVMKKLKLKPPAEEEKLDAIFPWRRDRDMRGE